MIRGSQFAASSIPPVIRGSQYAPAPSSNPSNITTEVPQGVIESKSIAVKGGWVSKDDFYKLSPAEQARLREVGVDQFNAENEAKIRQFKAANVEVKGGWVAKAEFDIMSPANQARIKAIGVDAFNAENAARQAAVDAKLKNYVAPEGGYYIVKAVAEGAISEAELAAVGYDVTGLGTDVATYKTAVAEDAAFKAANVELKGTYSTGEWVDKAFYDALPAADKEFINHYGTNRYNSWVFGGRPNLSGVSLHQIDYILKTGSAGAAIALGVADRKRQEVIATLAGTKYDAGGDSYRIVDAVADGTVSIATVRAANMYDAPTLDQIEQDAKTLATLKKDYYVPEHTESITDPKFIGPVDDNHPAPTVTFKVPEGYNTAQAYIDKKVTISQLEQAGFLTTPQEVEQFKTQAATTQRINTALQAINKPEYVDNKGQYNLQAIYHDKPISSGDIILIFGKQPGDSPAVAAQKKAALMAAIKGNAAHAKAELAKEYRPVGSRAASISRTYLDWTVPGYATQRHWDEMSNTWRAVSIVGDVLAIVPIVGAAGKGARGVTIAMKTGGRAARLSAAGKAVFGLGIASTGPGLAGKSLRVGEFWRQVAWAPELLGSVAGLGKPVVVGTRTVTGVRAVGSNVRTLAEATVGRVKSTVSPIESILHRFKIPESSVSVLGNSAVFKVGDVGADAMKARDELMRMAVGGKPIVLETGDVIIKARQAPLTKMTHGLAHTTPFGDEFIAGTVVRYKTGMPLREQGLFWSHDPVLGFSQASAYGKLGKRPSILICSKDFAETLTEASKKTYRDMMEMERISQVGTKIPKPEQILFTRLGHNGVRVELLLGTKLTKAQILKLKALGLIESIKNLYEPAITIESKSGKPLTKVETEKLAKILDSAGETTMARNLRYVSVDPSGSLRTIGNAYRTAASPEVYRTRIKADSNGIGSYLERVVPRQNERMSSTIRRAERVSTPARVANRLYVSAERFQPPRLSASSTRTNVTRVVAPSRLSRSGRIVETNRLPTTPRSSQTGRVTRIPSTSRTTPGPRIPVTPRYPSTPRGPLIIPPSSKSKGYPLKTYPPGAVGWRQGQLRNSVYWVMYREKGQAGEGSKVVMKYHGQEAPVGVKIVSGLRSAYESFGKTPGYIPREMRGELGIMDVKSLAHGKELRFKRVLSRGRKGKPTTSKVR